MVPAPAGGLRCAATLLQPPPAGAGRGHAERCGRDPGAGHGALGPRGRRPGPGPVADALARPVHSLALLAGALVLGCRAAADVASAEGPGRRHRGRRRREGHADERAIPREHRRGAQGPH